MFYVIDKKEFYIVFNKVILRVQRENKVYVIFIMIMFEKNC